MTKANPSALMKEVSDLVKANGYTLTRLEFVEHDPCATHEFKAGEYTRREVYGVSALSAISEKPTD